MLSIDKKYRTRGGLPARVVAELKTDSAYRFLGVCEFEDGKEGHRTYTEEGKVYIGEENNFDLIEVVEKTFYATLHNTPHFSVWESLKEAQSCDLYGKPVGVIKLVIENGVLISAELVK